MEGFGETLRKHVSSKIQIKDTIYLKSFTAFFN